MKSRTQKMILASLFAALTAVGAFIKIPLPPVPFTLQIFFVIFAGLLLGWKAGFASQAVYILVGLVGVPIFASGGGIQYVFNPTFGYLLGFAAAALVVGLITEKAVAGKPSFTKFFLASAAGVLVCYAIGVPYLYLVLKYVNHANVTASGMITKGFLLFLPWDIVKIALASWLAKEVYGRVNLVRVQDA